MIRIAKLTDYAIVLLTYVARNEKEGVTTARDLATQSHLPLPTVSKVLKTLARGGLLVSHRGVAGGFRLAKAADAISIAEIVAIMEGPIALTECSMSCRGVCEIERACPVKKNWRVINAVVLRSLENLTLSDMSEGIPEPSSRPRPRHDPRPALVLFAKR